MKRILLMLFYGWIGAASPLSGEIPPLNLGRMLALAELEEQALLDRLEAMRLAKSWLTSLKPDEVGPLILDAGIEHPVRTRNIMDAYAKAKTQADPKGFVDELVESKEFVRWIGFPAARTPEHALEAVHRAGSKEAYPAHRAIFASAAKADPGRALRMLKAPHFVCDMKPELTHVVISEALLPEGKEIPPLRMAMIVEAIMAELVDEQVWERNHVVQAAGRLLEGHGAAEMLEAFPPDREEWRRLVVVWQVRFSGSLACRDLLEHEQSRHLTAGERKILKAPSSMAAHAEWWHDLRLRHPGARF